MKRYTPSLPQQAYRAMRAGFPFFSRVLTRCLVFVLVAWVGSRLSAQNYTITTAGNAIVVTDVSGNGDILTVSESGGDIRFSTSATRTYSLDGGSTLNLPVVVPLSGVTTISIHAAGGNDRVNISAFTTALPSLTVNGGTGNDAVNLNDDITFAAGAHLDLDLQNDDATPGTDALTVAANANIQLSGAGTATIRVSQQVIVNAGGSVVTADGDLIVEANRQATPTSGNFRGVDMNGGTLEATGMGNVVVKGTVGSGSGSGIHLRSTGKIIGGTNGSTTVEGKGGSNTIPGNTNHGVYLTGAGVQITSSGGPVHVTGDGGTGLSSNVGVFVADAAQITAGGNGAVTVEGTCAPSTGVAVSGNTAQIASGGGHISVTGQGGGYGVLVGSTGLISAGGSGTVTVQGTGGAVSTTPYGVLVTGSNSKISSAGGNVSVTGQGGVKINTSRGVVVLNGEISVNGSGTLTVHGTGASTWTNGDGVALFGSGKIIGGTSGTVSIQGIGSVSASDRGNRGLAIQNTAEISSMGADVQVTGQGGGIGAIAYQNFGIELQSGARISAGGNGTVTVQGTGGPGLSTENYGVYINGLNTQITSSGGDVQVTGIEGGGTSGTGILLATTSLITTAVDGGNLTLVANSLSLNSAVSANGGSSVSLRPYTNGVAVDLGPATDPIGGPLSLSDAEWDRITAGTVNIGDVNSGDITVSAPVNCATATTINLNSGGALYLNAATLDASGGNIHIDAAGGIYPAAGGADIGAGVLSFAAGNDLNIAIDGPTVDAQYRQLNVSGGVDLAGLDLVLSGTYVPQNFQAFVLVDNDGADPITGTFNGLPEGAIISNFLGSGLNATITYTGGTGNDAVVEVNCPAVICPSDVTVSATTANPCSAVVAGIDAIYNDACAGATLTYKMYYNGALVGNGNGQASGQVFQPFNTSVQYNLSYDNLPASSCIFHVSVTFSNCTVDISGAILSSTDFSTGVKDAVISLTPTIPSLTTLSGVDGTYGFTVNYFAPPLTIKPVKNINKFNGVTVADVTAIQQHVANTTQLPAPFRRIAADINKSNSITALDASILNQALLGNPNANAIFNTSWRFVPTSHFFQDPNNFWWAFPDQISLPGGLMSNQTGKNFWGVKIGDVAPAWANPANFGAGEPLALRSNDRVLKAGELFDVVFNVGQLDDLAAFQFGLRFDPTQLRFEAAESIAGGLPLTPDHFGIHNVAEGEIRAVWSRATGLAVPEAAPAFQLRFMALESGGALSEALYLDEELLPARAYTAALAESGVELQIDQASGTNDPAAHPTGLRLLQNRPNPFSGRTVAGFVLPAAGAVQLRVLDVNGREIARIDKTYPAGYNEETLRLDGFSGVLYLELTTPWGVLGRKMVAVD